MTVSVPKAECTVDFLPRNPLQRPETDPKDGTKTERCSRPVCVDLFCGLGGWTEGFMAEGYECIGFDIERHVYGEHRYPAELVLQDVRTLDGRQFAGADMIVASSPCQEFSYRAMPWKRAKALGPPELGMELFAQAARIQREASIAAGRHIPMVQENVRGAQRWVGRARWHYGSYYLWGDVPALMPTTMRCVKVATMGAGWYPPGHPKHMPGLGFNTHADRATRLGDGIKAGDRRTVRADGSVRWTNTFEEAERQNGVKIGGDWFSDPNAPCRQSSSRSKARKAAAARIAKIPFELARHIAHVYHPGDAEAVA